MKNYGEILKEHRLARGLTLKEIENRTNINNGSLSRWERNEVLPSIESCVILANFYGMTLDELLGLDEYRIITAGMEEILTSEERKLVEVYNSLSPDMQQTLWSLLSTWSPAAATKKRT